MAMMNRCTIQRVIGTDTAMKNNIEMRMKAFAS